MDVNIPTDLEAFVQAAVTSGSFGNESEVVDAALRLLQQQEVLRQDVMLGFHQLDRGESTTYTRAELASHFESIKTAGRVLLKQSNLGPESQ